MAADVRRVGDPTVVDTLVSACCSGSGTHRRQREVVVERVLSNPRAARSRACLYILQVAGLTSGEAMRAYRHESTYSASVRLGVSRVAFRYSLASCLSVIRPRTSHRSRCGTCERVLIIVGVGVHPNLEAPVQPSPAAHANSACVAGLSCRATQSRGGKSAHENNPWHFSAAFSQEVADTHRFRVRFSRETRALPFHATFLPGNSVPRTPRR
ncbi:hypothetical protein SAMN05216348_103188 [Olsenella sp. KH3B4]|nr:hypothetical protein SAMN05216348_103188 [Olsenella sp. KH3B4]